MFCQPPPIPILQRVLLKARQAVNVCGVTFIIRFRKDLSYCLWRPVQLFDVSSAKNKGKCKAMYKPSRRSYWNTEDGKPPPGALTFPGQSDAADKQHSVTMWCCDISPDGNYIVSSGDDCRLKVLPEHPCSDEMMFPVSLFAGGCPRVVNVRSESMYRLDPLYILPNHHAPTRCGILRSSHLYVCVVLRAPWNVMCADMGHKEDGGFSECSWRVVQLYTEEDQEEI